MQRNRTTVKEKSQFCTKLTENDQENLMQGVRTSILNSVMKPCSLSTSQMKKEIFAKCVEWWPQILFPHHQSLEKPHREQQITTKSSTSLVAYNFPMCPVTTFACPAHSCTVLTFILFNIW